MKYKKYIKRFIIGLLSCILLTAIAVFILITFYKKELASALINNLKDDYGLILKVEDVKVSFFSNWPKASIQLKNTYLASELYSDKTKPILTAGSIVLSLELLKLLKNQFIIEKIVIQDAKINLVKDKDGSKNFELKSKIIGANKNAIKFEINKVAIKNTQFNFIETERGQNINLFFIDDIIKLKHEQDGFEAKILGEVKVGGLLFKPKKGAFLKNTIVGLDLHMSVFAKSKTIYIHSPSSVLIENHSYTVNSFIELTKNKQLMLSIEGKNLNYKKCLPLLNTNLQKNLSNINLNKPIDVKLLVITKIGVRQDPIIIAHINGINTDVTIGHSKIPYSHLSFKGTIVSLDSSKQKGNTENATVSFKSIKGMLYEFPFTASVTIYNFDKPKINIDANLFITASKVNFKPGKDFILKGTCLAKIKYSGPTNKLNKKEFLDAPMKLDASLFFNKLSYQEVDKPHVYTIDGITNLKNKDLKFENLIFKTDAGNVILKGVVSGFANYVLGYANGFKATLNARSESFNLNPFLIKKGENKRETSPVNYKNTIKGEQSNFEFNVSLFAKKLFVRNVKATNANVNLIYNNKLLNIKSVNMDACNGKLFATGTMYDLKKISAEVKIEGMDVTTLFKEFENFGQTAIDGEQLQGNIFIDAKIKAALDDKMEVIGNTMDGEIKLKLKDGHLLNFEPLQNISDYVFRNRNFKDVSFSEINGNCKINGFEMNIKEMEIGSNVLNLFVSGKYHFKANSNINMLIPWSNLKKRGKNYIPINSGQGIENSKGLKLNYSGPPKKLKLSLGHK